MPTRSAYAAALQNVQGSGTFVLDPSHVNSIGRAEHADLRVRQLKVSKIHALIYWDGQRWFVADCSSNGSFVNERKIQRCQLQPGDVLKIADEAEWLFCESDSDILPKELAGTEKAAVSSTPGPIAATDDWLILGSTRSTAEVRRQVNQIADQTSPVLIRGELGAGKRHTARALHMSGPQRSATFLNVNCSTVDAAGIHELQSNRIPHATGDPLRLGTVLLDEVTELSLDAQQALLDLLEEHSGRIRLGQPAEQATRYVAASTRDPGPLVESGHFHHDLWVKLSVVQLYIDPLRDRREEIPELATYFARMFSLNMHRSQHRLSEATIELLSAYDWPGNVLELKNAIERAVLFCQSRELVPADLAEGIGNTFRDSSQFEGLSLEEVEKRHIDTTLRALKWKKSRTAAVLGIERSTLDRKIKRYDLRRES